MTNKTIEATSKNGTFKLIAEHDNGRTYRHVKSQNYGIYIDIQDQQNATISVSSVNTDSTDRIRVMAAVMLEAADFVDEINAIINAK